jgi:hypothetical protein
MDWTMGSNPNGDDEKVGESDEEKRADSTDRNHVVVSVNNQTDGSKRQKQLTSFGVQ